MLRATARGGGAVAPGHGATAESGPDQVSRLTVVLESAADAQSLVRFLALFWVEGDEGPMACRVRAVYIDAWAGHRSGRPVWGRGACCLG